MKYSSPFRQSVCCTSGTSIQAFTSKQKTREYCYKCHCPDKASFSDFKVAEDINTGSRATRKRKGAVDHANESKENCEFVNPLIDDEAEELAEYDDMLVEKCLHVRKRAM